MAVLVSCRVVEARLVLDQLTLALEEVLVGDHLVAVTVLQTAAEGFISAQLSGCLYMEIQSLLPGVYVRTRTGDSRGLWVMRTRTRSVGATEGLRGVVVEKLDAGGVFSRRRAEVRAPSSQGDFCGHGAQRRALQLVPIRPETPPGVPD